MHTHKHTLINTLFHIYGHIRVTSPYLGMFLGAMRKLENLEEAQPATTVQYYQTNSQFTGTSPTTLDFLTDVTTFFSMKMSYNRFNGVF